MNYYDVLRQEQHLEEDRLHIQADIITNALKGQFAPKSEADFHYIIQKLKGETRCV